MIHYQGVVNGGGTPFNGPGQFKFAIVDAAGTTTYWSNDGSSTGGGEPANAVLLTVNSGLFNVLLGDASLTNMTPLADTAFATSDTYLRVWFTNQLTGFELLSPDQRLSSVPYALRATYAENAAALEARIVALENTLAHISTVGNDIYIDGANLHVRNGLNDTTTTNGLGNLIIGYNEVRGVGNDRSGSHVLVVGKELNFSSYGGIVVGWHNTISGTYASVSGGRFSIASGDYASVSGGSDNTASGNWTSISGGANNTATAAGASISGGANNTVSGNGAAISGGFSNIASGFFASVSGGDFNTASGGIAASVSGGTSNTASGSSASVSGGFNHSATGGDDWRAGSLFEDQ
jgi:hypothetical protein